MTRIFSRRGLLSFALLACTARGAAAQSCTTGNGAHDDCSGGTGIISIPMAMTVGKTVRLEASASSLALASGDLSAADYAAGFKTAGSISITARANTGIAVTLAAATTNFTYSGSVSPAPTKAASTVLWSLNSFATAGTALSTSGGTVIANTGSGNAGATTGTTATVSFRTNLGWATDPPGTYSLTLNFTVTAP
jgi:hypothetical protein